MSSASDSLTGIGVIDTTTLWSAAIVLDNDDYSPKRYNPAAQGRYAPPNHYFASFLHCLILYDELRTDFEVLNFQPREYMDLVRNLVSDLTPSGIQVSAMPTAVKHTDVALSLLPAFIEKTKEKARSGGLHQDQEFIRPSEYLDSTPYDDYSFQHSADQPEYLDSASYDDYSFQHSADQPERERAKSELRQLAQSTAIMSVLGKDIENNQRQLERDLNIIARSVRYSAHSRSILSDQGIPSAFNAVPGRLRILREYMAADKLSELTVGLEASMDLFSKLGLPRSGYNFSMYGQNINPLPLSDLWTAVRHLPPSEALAKTMELRITQEAQDVRGIWADRIWKSSSHVIEGHSQTITNTSARDIYQVLMVPADPEDVYKARRKPKAKSFIRKFLPGPKDDLLRSAILKRLAQ